MPLWTSDGTLIAEIGLVSLGDVVLPVFASGDRVSSKGSIRATTYRSEQLGGVLRVVALQHGLPGSAAVLAERRLEISRARAGEASFELCFELKSKHVLTVSQQGGQEGWEAFDIELPESISELPKAGLSDEACSALQRSLVAAEIFMRWLRTLLREPSSRRAVRGRFDDFVSLCDRVEASIDAEDAEALRDSLDKVREEAVLLTEQLGVLLFPMGERVLYLPES